MAAPSKKAYQQFREGEWVWTPGGEDAYNQAFGEWKKTGEPAEIEAAGGTTFKGGNAQLNQVLALLKGGKLEAALGTQQAIGQYKKSLPVIQKAFKGAMGNVKLAASDARRQALEGGVQARAGVGQALASRGLYNTSLLGNARSNVLGQTSANLGQINSGAAGMLGQLSTGQSMAQQQAYSQIAGGLIGGSQQQSNLTGQMAGTIQSVQSQPKSSLWDLLGAAAPYFAAFSGGFGGGGTPGLGINGAGGGFNGGYQGGLGAGGYQSPFG